MVAHNQHWKKRVYIKANACNQEPVRKKEIEEDDGGAELDKEKDEAIFYPREQVYIQEKEQDCLTKEK
ncbi:hypothetical protein RJT34_07795 [Clitoria ternatea]|uniref:Uncharacterized protein n=1 Tax=Clitoria ternatea TaxID=43366 RepID=A0AAN9PV82_CLITE